MTHLGNDWDALLAAEFEKPYIGRLKLFLNDEYKNNRIYPPKADLFTALVLTEYCKVKVVILGQDPYHQPNQAHGLSFSVKEGNRVPPSLKNIYKEIATTTSAPIFENGDLTRWAEQGVLLLNTVLTVREGEAGSHRLKGWEQLTDYIITLLNDRADPIVFLLWGADAKKKLPLITNTAHSCFTAAHPSPLSAYNGFFGCDHFNKANKVLRELGKSEIVW